MAKQRDGGISWTEETWNPVTGCTKVSAGCQYCYAERLAASRQSKSPRYAGTIQGERWSGQVNLHWDMLDEPLRWRKPRLVFVCSMSDVFHEAVPDDFLERLFATMAQTPRHTYQLLTKRPERMAEVDRYMPFAIFSGEGGRHTFPALPNVWMGVSVEDQQRADERIPYLLRTPTPIRWLSVEPMLGPVNLRYWLFRSPDERPQWVICGAESGPGARPMDLEWARDLRDQCDEARVPFRMKQLDGNRKRLEDFPKDLRIRQWPVGFNGPGKQASISVEEVVRQLCEWEDLTKTLSR